MIAGGAKWLSSIHSMSLESFLLLIFSGGCHDPDVGRSRPMLGYVFIGGIKHGTENGTLPAEFLVHHLCWSRFLAAPP